MAPHHTRAVISLVLNLSLLVASATVVAWVLGRRRRGLITRTVILTVIALCGLQSLMLLLWSWKIYEAYMSYFAKVGVEILLYLRVMGAFTLWIIKLLPFVSLAFATFGWLLAAGLFVLVLTARGRLAEFVALALVVISLILAAPFIGAVATDCFVLSVEARPP